MEKSKLKGVFIRVTPEEYKKFKYFCIANNWSLQHLMRVAANRLINEVDKK